MRRSQGRPFATEEIDKIKYLLSSTDLSLQDIAIRMDCAKSSIVTINQTFGIREYRGRRRYWVCSPAQDIIDAAEQTVHIISRTAS